MCVCVCVCVCVFVFSMGKRGESDKAMTSSSQFCKNNISDFMTYMIIDQDDDFAYVMEVFTNRLGYI